MDEVYDGVLDEDDSDLPDESFEHVHNSAPEESSCEHENQDQ